MVHFVLLHFFFESYAFSWIDPKIFGLLKGTKIVHDIIQKKMFDFFILLNRM